jgi:eukaryotic-like serine/threonine-protein kinase
MSAETLNPFEEPAPHSSIRPHSATPDSGARAASAAGPRGGVAVGGVAPGDGSAPDGALPDGALGRVLGGKYRVERKIGEGAMGVVLAATHIALDELVAIKFMRPEVQRMEGTLERFAKEAKIAARIRSEHVVKMLDVGDVAPLGPYIVMEYLEGKSLADLLDARLFDRRGPMSAERVVEYLLQACEALASAHAIGVIHRDVKPDNLFVTRHAGLETLKLLDFGISKAALTARAPDADVGTSTTAFVMGTPLYMSPEQLRSLPDLDGRTDIWSMGAVMYELLSGKPPFHAASVPEICAAILDSQPAPLPPSCPAALEAVVMRCLEKDRERRFQTVAELASALLPLAPGEARAYASRASCILRASALQLDMTPDSRQAAEGTGAARGGRHGSRLQSSALVAAATVLALSALGVAISLSRSRTPSAAHGGPPVAASVGAPALAASAAVPAASSPTSGAATHAPEPMASFEPPVQAAAAPAKSTPARSPARASAPASPSTSAVNEALSANPGVPAAALSSAVASSSGRLLDGSDSTRRVRLVEPRSRLRLVGRVDASPRPALVERAAARPARVSPQRGAAP